MKGHIAKYISEPGTLHYTGQGRFRLESQVLDLSERFKPQNL